MSDFGTNDNRERVSSDDNTWRCFEYGIIDYSEPCFWVSLALGLAGVIYAIVVHYSFYIAVSSFLVIVGIIATWRVRRLGVAFSLMESVNDLQAENARLRATALELRLTVSDLDDQVNILTFNNERLADQIKTFAGVTEILQGTERDFEEVLSTLHTEWRKIHQENERYESNNMLSLFNIVDKDSNGQLSGAEVTRLKDYVRIVYNIDLDLNRFDKDNDGNISLEEFVKKFEASKGARNTPPASGSFDSMPSLEGMDIV